MSNPTTQSVVVVPLEDWRHVIGALKNAKARLPMGAAIGNVSDALSKVEHLQAAPAPSSLAGGEVLDPAYVTRLITLARECERLGPSNGLDTPENMARASARQTLISATRPNAILAALSPEAPAREVRKPDEMTENALRSRAKSLLKLKGWRAGDKIHIHGMIELLTQFGMDVSESPEEDRCNHPECGCDFDEVCDAALTPRHEAPAEGEAWRRAVDDLRAYQPEDEELSIIKQKVVPVAETTRRLVGLAQCRDAIARCIIGPRDPVPEGSKWALDELREVRWSSASVAERQDALWAAASILALTPRHEAPASDEVSKQRDEAIRIAQRLHDTVESLIYGLPKYLDDTAQTDEENMIGKAWHVFDAAAYGLAALPKVEPVQDLHELPQPVHEAPASEGAVSGAFLIGAVRDLKTQVDLSGPHAGAIVIQGWAAREILAALSLPPLHADAKERAIDGLNKALTVVEPDYPVAAHFVRNAVAFIEGRAT